jgi:hypothetical protein
MQMRGDLLHSSFHVGLVCTHTFFDEVFRQVGADTTLYPFASNILVTTVPGKCRERV